MLPGIQGIHPVIGATASAGSGTSLWKIEILSTRSAGFAQISTMTAHATEGGAAIAGVTYTATETNGINVASNLGDGVAGVWQATSSTADVEMTVPSSTVVEIAIASGNAYNTDSPLNFNIYKDVGGSWVLQKSVVGAPYRANSDTLRFPIGRTLAASEANNWELLVNTTQGAGAFPSCKELEFRTVSGSSASDISTTTSYLALNGTTTAATCFDDSTAAALGFGGTAPRYVGCRTSAPGNVIEIAYWNAAANDSFKSVTVRYWDSEAFVTHWTYSGAAMLANASRIDTKP